MAVISISDLFPAVRKLLPASLKESILAVDSQGFWITLPTGESFCMKEVDALYAFSPDEKRSDILKRLNKWH